MRHNEDKTRFEKQILHILYFSPVKTQLQQRGQQIPTLMLYIKI